MSKARSPYLEDPWVAQVYDYRVELGERDLPLYLALAEESGDPILELACGTGRVLLPLARAGHQVTGVDLSPYMLTVARRKLEQESPAVRERVSLVEGDMCDFHMATRFPLILIPFRSFQILPERSDQRRCLECCHRHLAQAGHLVINVFRPKRAETVTSGRVQEKVREFAGPGGTRVRFGGHTDFDAASQSLVWHTRAECTSADGKVTIREHQVHLRYFFRFEMEWMLEACGFEVEALYGNFDRTPFTAESPEMIFVARRKE